MTAQHGQRPAVYYVHRERSSAGCDGWSAEFANALEESGATRVALAGPGYADLSMLVPFAEQIEELFLDCPVADHSHLAVLTRLHLLSLGHHCNPQNIDFARLKSLRRLKVSHDTDQIGSIGSARHLTRLEVIDCRLRDLSLMRGLDSLEHLSITEAPLQSLDGIGALPALQKLTLSQVPLRSLGQIEQAINLRELDLYSMPRLESVAPLVKVRRLRALSLEGARKICDLPTIGDIASLEDLRLQALAIPASLDFIGRLARLKEFHFEVSGTVPSLRFLLPLKKLEVLLLGQKLIIENGDLSVLLEMPGLKEALFWDRSAYSHRRDEIQAALERGGKERSARRRTRAK